MGGRRAKRTLPGFPGELREGALALADGKGERARLVAFTRAAHRAGVRLGMTVCQARAMTGGEKKLRVFPTSPADTAAAQAALADVGYGFAPRVQSEADRNRLLLRSCRVIADDRHGCIAQRCCVQNRLQSLRCLKHERRMKTA